MTCDVQCAELLGTLASGGSAPAVDLVVQLLQHAATSSSSSSSSSSSNTRALCAASACNHALITPHCSPLITPALPHVIAAVDSPDLLVRRTALLALTSASHSHMGWLTPDITCQLMDVLVRHVKLDESLMRQVQGRVACHTSLITHHTFAITHATSPMSRDTLVLAGVYGPVQDQR